LIKVDYTSLRIMSLTLALSEREQNLLTHANLAVLIFKSII